MKVHGWTLTDPDADPAPDPALFVSDLQDANKKYLFFNKSNSNSLIPF
jgi:hypothetical protein